jgi:hypothetical protein
MVVSPLQEISAGQYYAIGLRKDTDIATLTAAVHALRAAAQRGNAQLAGEDYLRRPICWKVVACLDAVELHAKKPGGHWDATWLDVQWAPGAVQNAAQLPGSAGRVKLRISLTKHNQSWRAPPRLAFSGISCADPRHIADMAAAMALGRALAWLDVSNGLPTWLLPCPPLSLPATSRLAIASFSLYARLKRNVLVHVLSPEQAPQQAPADNFVYCVPVAKGCAPGFAPKTCLVKNEAVAHASLWLVAEEFMEYLHLAAGQAVEEKQRPDDLPSGDGWAFGRVSTGEEGWYPAAFVAPQ